MKIVLQWGVPLQVVVCHFLKAPPIHNSDRDCHSSGGDISSISWHGWNARVSPTGHSPTGQPNMMNQGAWRGTTWPGWNDMLFFVCHDSLQGSRTQGKKLEMMGRYFFDRPFHPQPKWSNWWFGYRSLTFGTSGELTDREHHRVKTFIFWLLYYIILLYIYILYIYIIYIYIIYITTFLAGGDHTYHITFPSRSVNQIPSPDRPRYPSSTSSIPNDRAFIEASVHRDLLSRGRGPPKNNTDTLR